MLAAATAEGRITRPRTALDQASALGVWAAALAPGTLVAWQAPAGPPAPVKIFDGVTTTRFVPGAPDESARRDPVVGDQHWHRVTRKGPPARASRRVGR